MKHKTNIIICGDICPTDDTKHFFDNDDAVGLFNNTLPLLQKADVLLANMEFTLTDNCKAATKTGPILFGQSKYIGIFKKVGFDVLGLANNHIKDCGAKAVIETMDTCLANGIQTVGAGKNEKQAKKPLIIEKNGWKIGIMAFAEHEFNAAYESEAGANLFDIFEDFDRIKEFKKKVDYLIILNHGGIEYYEYPSPLLQKKCRKMIDSGADYVVNQHSHVIGTEEDYKHGKILYGQGNTVFGYRSNNSTWNKGLLINIELGNKITVNNTLIYATPKGIELGSKKDQKNIIRVLENRKKQIKEAGFIKNSWTEFCETKKANYLPHLFGLGKVFNKLNRIFNNKLIDILFTKKQFLITNNLISCESHREVIQTLLKRHNK